MAVTPTPRHDTTPYHHAVRPTAQNPHTSSDQRTPPHTLTGLTPTHPHINTRLNPPISAPNRRQTSTVGRLGVAHPPPHNGAPWGATLRYSSHAIHHQITTNTTNHYKNDKWKELGVPRGSAAPRGSATLDVPQRAATGAAAGWGQRPLGIRCRHAHATAMRPRETARTHTRVRTPLLHAGTLSPITAAERSRSCKQTAWMYYVHGIGVLHTTKPHSPSPQQPPLPPPLPPPEAKQPSSTIINYVQLPRQELPHQPLPHSLNDLHPSRLALRIKHNTRSDHCGPAAIIAEAAQLTMVYMMYTPLGHNTSSCEVLHSPARCTTYTHTLDHGRQTSRSCTLTPAHKRTHVVYTYIRSCLRSYIRT